MKPSLADRVLEVIERSDIPVETPILVRMAEVSGYKKARSAVHVTIKMLRLNGYIRPHKVGKGNRPSSWVPTVAK